jgi:SAM-dependent methyltransferase
VARAIGYGGGAESLTVHRALSDPRANGRTTFTRLHDLLIEHLPSRREPRVLDAGCGLGGTMLALADALGAICTGLTLSRSQASSANAVAATRGYSKRVEAVVQSYDDPPDGPFDIVVAIESLAHSADPTRSVAALARVLAPGGHLVVVDDMPEPGALDSADFETFKSGWQCPVLWTAREYREGLSALGLELVHDVDLTEQMRPRPRWAATVLMAVNRAAQIFPVAGLRRVLESHLGGLALERLARDRQVRYRLLVARRPELQVS